MPFSSCLQSFPASATFQMSWLCIRWPKYWSFSSSISPSSEYSGLISFRIDWFDLFGIQETLKSLLQYHYSKASILWSSDFMVQLSHLYMSTRKTIAFVIWTFVGKAMSLLSRFVIAFLPEQVSFKFMDVVTILRDFGAQEKKICHCFHFFPIYLPWIDGTGCCDLSFLNAGF